MYITDKKKLLIVFTVNYIDDLFFYHF